MRFAAAEDAAEIDGGVRKSVCQAQADLEIGWKEWIYPRRSGGTVTYLPTYLPVLEEKENGHAFRDVSSNPTTTRYKKHPRQARHLDVWDTGCRKTADRRRNRPSSDDTDEGERPIKAPRIQGSFRRNKVPTRSSFYFMVCLQLPAGLSFGACCLR